MAAPSQDYQNLYRAGIAAARAREFHRARKLFLAAVTLDEGQKSGWLALARLEADPAAKAGYYRHVLELDPNDAVARAFIEGTRQARPWYRSRLVLGLIGLLALLLGGTLALLATRPGDDSRAALPTAAQLPSLTPAAGIQLAAPLNLESSPAPTDVPTEGVVSPESPAVQPQVTFFSLDAPPSETATAAPSATTFPTSTLAPPPTGEFIAPPPAAPSATPGSAILITVVTVPPTSTNASGTTPTPQPLFQDLTDPPPTGLPVFATPTLEFEGDFNTEVPPTEQTFPEDPNSGGMRAP